LLKSAEEDNKNSRVLSPQEEEAHERFKRYKEQYSKLTNSSRSYIMLNQSIFSW
jgi:hypothetical protein